MPLGRVLIQVTHQSSVTSNNLKQRLRDKNVFYVSLFAKPLYSVVLDPCATLTHKQIKTKKQVIRSYIQFEETGCLCLQTLREAESTGILLYVDSRTNHIVALASKERFSFISLDLKTCMFQTLLSLVCAFLLLITSSLIASVRRLSRRTKDERSFVRYQLSLKLLLYFPPVGPGY